MNLRQIPLSRLKIIKDNKNITFSVATHPLLNKRNTHRNKCHYSFYVLPRPRPCRKKAREKGIYHHEPFLSRHTFVPPREKKNMCIIIWFTRINPQVVFIFPTNQTHAASNVRINLRQLISFP